MSLFTMFCLTISIFAMFYGVRRMGDIPEWNVVSGFMVFIDGVVGAIITLFFWAL